MSQSYHDQSYLGFPNRYDRSLTMKQGEYWINHHQKIPGFLDHHQLIQPPPPPLPVVQLDVVPSHQEPPPQAQGGAAAAALVFDGADDDDDDDVIVLNGQIHSSYRSWPHKHLHQQLPVTILNHQDDEVN